MTYILNNGKTSTIPGGSLIYRGQTDAFDIRDGTAFLARNIISRDKPTFFGTSPEQISENYGLTVALRVVEDIRLANIENPEVYRELMDLMLLHDTDAYEALMDSYPLVDGVVMRDSNKANDFKVVEFICKYTDHEGYIQPRMPKIDGGFMHSEIAICHPSGIAKIIQPYGDQAIRGSMSHQGVMDEYRMRLVSESLRNSRKRQHEQHWSHPPSPPVGDHQPQERPLKRRLF